MKRYAIEVLDSKQIEALSRKELAHNEYICETAGFEPLEVRLKRFEQQGLLRQVQRSEITSSDLREMYLNPDYSINIDDDPEDIIEKMGILQKHIAEVKQKAHERAVKNSKPGETTASPGSQAVSAAVDEEKASSEVE